MRFLVFFLPLLFIGCDQIKEQHAIDKRLEEVGLEMAESGEKAASASMIEDVKEREAKLSGK